MSQVLTKQDAEGLHTYLCVRTSIAFYSRGKEAQQTFASRQFGEASGYVTPLQGCLYLREGRGSNKLAGPWERDERLMKAGMAEFNLKLKRCGSFVFIPIPFSS